MTLDYAAEQFEFSPTEKTARDYLEAAREYEADEMISADQLRSVESVTAKYIP